MAKVARWWGPALLLGIVVLAPGAGPQLRTWSDATGEFKIEAELVEVRARKAILKKSDGSEVTVPLASLSDTDRKFIKSQQAEIKQNTSKQADDKETPANPEDLEIVIAKATEFYEDLRTEERTIASELLTTKAIEIHKAGQSTLKDLPKPDKAKRAIRVGKPKIEGTAAQVPVKVTVAGNTVATTAHLRQEENEWRVFALSAMYPTGEKTLDFEAGSASEERVDPLKALMGNPLELVGYTVEGRPFDLSAYKGKIVLVDFWASWCPSCVAEMPNIKANWDKYHAAGFEVVAVSVDRNLNQLEAYLAGETFPWVVVADHYPKNQKSAGSKYGIRGLPALMLLGPDGKVAAIHCRGPALGREIEKLLQQTAATK